ncbi:amino acid ABC transporter permease [Egibacter rhizosphaerae]|uniref:Amino acid ABC transporter permease n=1 Tax=Egibacter rhizosphaerae TaxID=1670831 RepID=A0A411YJS9_9ACTN|nr:amino acid ABC transporter permease [Egibacter rhizosphaerae]QBI21454.1 amino acid ABC transporter permease [Egibacter rhizosphaerae]
MEETALERVVRLLFNPEVFARVLPDLLTEGLRNTILISFSAMALGLVFGMVLALMRISRRWWLKAPAQVYIDIFRGLPAILVIFFVGIGMPIAGFRPFGREQLLAAIAALTLVATAYITEIFRAGIQSVDKGQMEAARSVGMGYLQAMWLVIIPQGVRRVLPPLTNEFIALIKDSSLVFIIGTTVGSRELYRIGQSVTQDTGNASAIVAAGLCYLIITVPLTYLVNWWDKRLREGKPQSSVPVSAGSVGRGGGVARS